MERLTKRQQMVLEYVNQCIKDKGYPPTLREIGAFMGIRSTNGVSDHLRALERKGYLKRIEGRSRAISTRETFSSDVAETLVDLTKKLSASEERVKQLQSRLLRVMSVLCKKPCSRNCCSWKAREILVGEQHQ